MLFKNHKQRAILFSESGISRWQAAPVAGAIVRRIRRNGSVTICKSEVAAINRMHEVLHTGGSFETPFQSLAADLDWITIPFNELGF